jgi:hypothetical protein
MLSFLSSLGYEHYDDCLCGFKLSFIMALTSAGSRRKADSGALHLPRLSLSRPVACTNPCTNPVPDLPVPLRPIPEGPRHGSGRLGRNAARAADGFTDRPGSSRPLVCDLR